jgi:hypothetical protein
MFRYEMSMGKHFYIIVRKIDGTGTMIYGDEINKIKSNYNGFSYITNNVRKYIIKTGATANWPSNYNSNLYYCKE